MEITKVSDEGQVIIPQPLLKGDGILLKPKKPFVETTLADVAGCLKYTGTPKTQEEIDEAICQGVENSSPELAY